MQPLIALLGRRDVPTDGLEDYCTFLGEGLQQHGLNLEKVRVDWAERGWMRSLFSLWQTAGTWRGRWVVLQFTSLAWSRRGFPVGALVAVLILRRRGARTSVVYHDSGAFEGTRWVDQLRRVCQVWILGALYRATQKPIFADPLEKISWLPAGRLKAASIPIGGNLPEPPGMPREPQAQNGKPKTIAVYCLSQSPHRELELADISTTIQQLAEDGLKLSIQFVGRGTSESKAHIESTFRNIRVEHSVLGIKTAGEISRILAHSDAMLCVRGRLFPRRGSALAGIACGLPIVAYAGAAEGTPLEQAGVELVPYRDVPAMTEALRHILTDGEYWRRLHIRSMNAQQKYFSWDAIARQFVAALEIEEN